MQPKARNEDRNLAYLTITQVVLGFPGGTYGKESTCNVGDLGSVPGLGRSLAGGHGNPLQYSCLENPHGERSLTGFCPWDCKESDMTEQLSTLGNQQSYVEVWVSYEASTKIEYQAGSL